jgi:transposase
VHDEDFADCYSEHHGRPSIPPSLLARVLLLAYRDGLSDERAMEAVRFDLRWKIALDLPIDHPGGFIPRAWCASGRGCSCMARSG